MFSIAIPLELDADMDQSLRQDNSIEEFNPPLGKDTVTRRRLLTLAGACSSSLWLPTALSCVPSLANAQSVSPAARPEPPQPTERAAMAAVAAAFIQKHAVPGLSVAIGHLDRPLYQEAFGVADRERNEALTPRHLFRIASVTKPITSVAIFSLIEQGRLALGERVFGPVSVLGTDFGRPPYYPGIDQITSSIYLLTLAAVGATRMTIRCSGTSA